MLIKSLVVKTKPNIVSTVPLDDIGARVLEFALLKMGVYISKTYSTNQCIIASTDLKNYLIQCGFDEGRLTLLKAIGPKFALPTAATRWNRSLKNDWQHVFLKDEKTGACYDLTMRQFDPNCAYPYVTFYENCVKNWNSIELYVP